MGLNVVNIQGNLLANSRDVAKMIGKRHSDLLRSIDGYVEILLNAKMRSVDFFIKNTYQDSTGRELPCYFLTRKGCDMVANKLTGEKGVLFTAAYVTKFEEMEKQLYNSYKLPTNYKEALLQLVEQVEQNEKLQTENLVLSQQVNELKPKATYYDLVLQNKSLLSVSQIAKDYGLGAPTLNKKLHELGVQYKQGGVWLLYSKYQDKGYTQTTTHVIDEEKSKIHTKWTQKGRLFIYELLRSVGILPLIEREDVA
ncbi:phage antirepressor KilAC domain-containing protein [Heyndrickxia camelliae]|uniref:Rha family transcriptional regulator n=1 Tax=Heyndrickxia camelliae TaxID=1707093 RepID=A0A2N3LDX9_9BACI|nr:phage antirepressor KilAC domain-containing protein [Heyndrickxia camelliae]PKR82799.1 Rha family transcriptional regulator [Heyndrickxia camelliae]